MITWIKKHYWSIISSVIYITVVVFAVIALMSKFSIGGVKLYSVQSGSMEPAIGTGSMVMVKSQANYEVGDIITYQERQDPQKTITHRIIKKEYTGIDRYTTKGDANDSPDANIVIPSRIIGKVIFNVPYFGFIVGFTRTLPGLILVIIIPATIIIYEEIKNIKREYVNIKNKKRNKNKGDRKK